MSKSYLRQSPEAGRQQVKVQQAFRDLQYTIRKAERGQATREDVLAAQHVYRSAKEAAK